MKDQVNVFEFKCPHAYLRAAWDLKQRLNPSFSLRAWGSAIGFTNNSTLSALLNEKRMFTKKQGIRFIKNLKLNFYEAEYFEAMIDHALADEEYSKSYYAKKMEKLQKVQNIRGDQLESFEYLASPDCLLVLELMSLKDFPGDIEWVISRADFNTTPESIYRAVEVLKKLELIVEDEKGSISKNRNSVHHQAPQEFFDEASAIYHKEFLENLRLKINKYPSKSARYSGFFFCMEKSKVATALQELWEFNDSFISKYEAIPGTGDITFMFGQQLAPCSAALV